MMCVDVVCGVLNMIDDTSLVLPIDIIVMCVDVVCEVFDMIDDTS